MKHFYFLTALMLCFAIHANAQNPGGKTYFADVDVFNSPGSGQGVIRFFNCGNAPSLAVDEAMTVEFWFKAAIPSDNQKIIGKINSTGAVFNNGYLIGIANSRINPEIWTPGNQKFEEGFIPPVSTWHHIAVTYNATGMYQAYLNGTLAHEQAANGNIVTSAADLIIGVGPWGNMDAFMAFGSIDEIRLWNVERSAEDIKGNMFKNLTGTEAGLVLYQNFDNDDGTNVVADLSSAGNNCTKIGMDDSNFIDSECVIADAVTQSMDDLNGIWFSSNAFLQDPRVVDTDNGLSLASNFNGQDTSAYVIWGHNGGTGTTTSELPANSPANSMRTARTWSATVFGNITPNMTFNLDNAAGGGTALPTGLDAERYTLLEQEAPTANFVAIANADAVSASDVTFNVVPVQGATYAIATGDAPFVTNIFEADNNDLAAVIFPNPTEGRVNIQLNEQASNANIMVYNTVGQLVQTMSVNTAFTELQLHHAGMYLIRIEANSKTFNQRIIVVN